ncbi:MAG: hypothetical protein LBG60_17820 [Bifidobacteriaceae bacterium]|jgi:hypothetical protein|nr:hypothetical protein [Bifidobacteriaceae bacterium]
MGWLDGWDARRDQEAAREQLRRAAGFAGVEEVERAAGAFDAAEFPESGCAFQLVVSPGSVRLGTKMVWELDRAPEPPLVSGDGWDQPALWEDSVRREIREWSRKSRANMVKTIAALDFKEWLSRSGGALGMVTLTLPREWLVVAPSGKAFKRLVRALRRRMVRAGVEPVGVWKLEFQRRGAPHLHIMMRCPTWVGRERFEVWLSRAWAEVCRDSLDPPERDQWVASGEFARHLGAGTAVDFDRRDVKDPRRAAIYFLGHSAKTGDGKEYQHRVPPAWRGEGLGPGRFWGVWGLKPRRRVVELRGRDWYRARRMLRHVRRARAWEVAASRARHAGRRVWDVVSPKVRGFGARGGGTVVVNDGPRLARGLAAALA